ncbi:MAG: DNA (cytosine-5-)-methyltransferase [Oscillospiraceae bacterium]|nr:DNA (cytosine-5-)-methyltransferase [Oscillospiraceae bacterium]
MTSSNANVRAVDSNSTHKFPWKWCLSDLANVKKNGLTVFSCFSCGGGSSMGYKLAGYDVIGNVEIDPRVMKVYQKNNHPKYPYLMDVREFLKIPDAELPKELFHLDILDGSPPCSVFSTAGEREKGWNKEKVFREGQARQKLDDLFFYFISIAQKLQPRVVIAENVSGLLKGNAKGYVNEIFKAFDAAGYKVQLFLLNAAFMGVPQKRERCFFVAQRKDQAFPKLVLNFREKLILFGEVQMGTGKPIETLHAKRLAEKAMPGEKRFGEVAKRLGEKENGFGRHLLWEYQVAPTIVSGDSYIRGKEKAYVSDADIVNIQTFPQDYDFTPESAKYICGMSVPPVMMAQVASEVYRQWLK